MDNTFWPLTLFSMGEGGIYTPPFLVLQSSQKITKWGCIETFIILQKKSCLEYVYCKYKYRYSEISVTDHDIVGYIRFSKVPASPSRTIRKRSYKRFVQKVFLEDLGNINWSDVYQCEDVDLLVVVFTR